VAERETIATQKHGLKGKGEYAWAIDYASVSLPETTKVLKCCVKAISGQGLSDGAGKCRGYIAQHRSEKDSHRLHGSSRTDCDQSNDQGIFNHVLTVLPRQQALPLEDVMPVSEPHRTASLFVGQGSAITEESTSLRQIGRKYLSRKGAGLTVD
jgi:hypothetical protein